MTHKIKTGPPLVIEATVESGEGWGTTLLLMFVYSIPNLIFYGIFGSLIGLGIYATGQWLGGQL